jgi:putative thiamine transport system ATP-binding protein
MKRPCELRLEGVTLRLGGRPLIGPLELTVPPGTIATLIGESGVGKSSLLAYLCGTLPTAFDGAGGVWVGGADVSSKPAHLRRMGILFQDDLLFPHLSVGQNLAFALPAGLRPKAERERRVAQALREAGLEGFAPRDPATLSGGQRARAALLRVLLSEPGALLLDEPFSRLDAVTRRRFREFVFTRVREAGLPALMVTHDSEDAAAAGGPVIPLRPAVPSGDLPADM